MVQIIQSGPSQATPRQQAMDQALGNVLGGIGAYQKQESDKAPTKRQQALDELQLQAKLADAGYDVTKGQISQALSPAPEQGFLDKLMGREAPIQAPVDLFAKRTPEYLAKQESAKTKAERESQMFGAELGYKQAQTKDIEAQAPLRAQKSQMELQKIQADLSMSPLARRKAEAEIKKLEADAVKSIRETGGNKLETKLIETQAIDLAKKTSNLYSVKTAMDKALNQLSDPNRSEEEKVKTGQGLLKLLNSAEGSDAVGAEEAKRIGDYLEYAMGNFTGPGGMRVGRDLPGFVSQVSNYSELLGERIKGNEEGLQAVKSGVPLSQLSGRTQPSGGLNQQQTQRLQELRAKQQGMAAR